MIKTNIFNYTLPEHLIAQKPLLKRDDSKLLYANPNLNIIEDHLFIDLPKMLNSIFQQKKCLILYNDTKVFPARIRIKRKTGARGEIFLLENKENTPINCLLRPQKKIKLHEIMYSDDEKNEELFKIVSLNPPQILSCNKTIEYILENHGEIPLPPYIVRDPHKVGNKYKELDKERYQTVFANLCGSVAAPTAGLHFSDDIIKSCLKHNCIFSPVTLHVGLGTFQPVQTEYINTHNIHEEYYYLSKQSFNLIIEQIKNNAPIIFVGTTSFRAVQSFFASFFTNDNDISFNNIVCNNKYRNIIYQNDNNLKNYEKYADNWYPTKLFIKPDNLTEQKKPLIGDAILTNFHQPESTLTMLVATLLGFNFWQQVYDHAIFKQYRFLSYGDSNLYVF